MGRFSTKSQINAAQKQWQTKWDELSKQPQMFFQDGNCNCDECIEDRKTIYVLNLFYEDVMPDLFWGEVPKLYDYYWLKEMASSRRIIHSELPSPRGDYIMAAAFSQAWANKDTAARKPRTYCRCCGQLMSQHDQINAEDIGPICPDCERRFFPKCSVCGTLEINTEYGLGTYAVKLFDSDEQVTEIDREVRMCNECFHLGYLQCNQCGYMVNSEAIYFVDQNNEISRVRPGRFTNHYCPECMPTVFSNCDVCGERGLTQNMVPFRLSDGNGNTGMRCTNCQMMLQDVLQYNQKPKPKYTVFNEQKTPRDDAPFFGVEFEVEMSDIENCCSRRALARIVKEIIGTEYMYSKHDGSLLSINGENGRGGLEIVTHPFSWKFYKNTNVFQTLFGILANEKWNAQSERCGNHIHITKNAFTSFHLFKFMRFFYNKRNRPFFKIMSARVNPDGDHCERYCKWWQEDARRLKNVVKRKRNMVPDKHGAVNLLNKETIEIRIFQGVDNIEDFSRNMEFVHSLIEFTREASAKECMLSKWLEFVTMRYNQYRHMLRYMYRRKRAFTAIYPEFKTFAQNKQLETAVQKGE